MAFSHFRRHEKLYLYIAFGAMFFALVVFAVPTALYNLADSDGASADFAGRFVDSSGETVEIPIEDYMSAARLVAQVGSSFPLAYRNSEDLMAFEHVIMAHEAKNAGIHVSDDQLRDVLKNLFGDLGVVEYRQLTAERFGGAKQIEQYLREVLAIGMLRGMTSRNDVTTEKEVYDSFAERNEIIEVAYVDFPYEDHVVDADSVSDETLQTYLDEMNENQRKSDFSTEEKFGLQIAYINYRETDLAQFTDVLESLAEPEEVMVERTFSMNRARYEEMVRGAEEGGGSEESGSEGDGSEENKEEEDSSEEDGEPGENPEGGDEGEDSEPSEDEPSENGDEEPVTLEQAREFVVKDLKLDALIREFEKEFNEYRDSLSPEDSDDQNLAPPEALVKTQLDAKFTELAEKYHLTIMTTESPIKKSEISELEHGADESLGFMVPVMKVEDIRVRPLRSGSEEGAVVRLIEKVDSEVKPLDEIREDLITAYVEEEKRQGAEAAANELYDKMRTLARTNAEESVAARETAAREAADKRIADESVEDEDEKQKIYEEELEKEQSEIDLILKPYFGDVFAKAAEEQGAELHQLPEFRKTFQVSPAYRRLSPGPKKFLAGFSSGVTTTLGVGDVTRVLSDNESDACYIARLLSSRKPTPEEMTPRDRQDSQFTLMRQQNTMMNDMMLRQQGRPIPNAIRELTLDYKLENFLQAANEEEETQ